MRICCFDLASRTGVAFGGVDAMPTIVAWPLRRAGQSTEFAVGNLGENLRDLFDLEQFDLVVAEEYLNPAAAPSADAVISQIMMHGCLEGIAKIYGIGVRRVPVATVRVHLCGKATAHPPRRKGSMPLSAREKAKNREDTKAMVFKQCVALGYFERGAKPDFDRADAAALFDFAAATYGRARRPFALQGQTL